MEGEAADFNIRCGRQGGEGAAGGSCQSRLTDPRAHNPDAAFQLNGLGQDIPAYGYVDDAAGLGGRVNGALNPGGVRVPIGALPQGAVFFTLWISVSAPRALTAEGSEPAAITAPAAPSAASSFLLLRGRDEFIGISPYR